MQVPARELQFSSLGFPPPQPVRTPPQPIASAFSAPSSSLRFPRATVDAEAFWVVSGSIGKCFWLWAIHQAVEPRRQSNCAKTTGPCTRPWWCLAIKKEKVYKFLEFVHLQWAFRADFKSQVLTWMCPRLSLYSRWASPLLEGESLSKRQIQLLQLNTHLVVFLSLSYQINIWQPRCLYAPLFSSHYAACTPHFIHLRTVHGYVLLLFVSILPPPCGCIMFHFSSIPWPCLMHASTSCY